MEKYKNGTWWGYSRDKFIVSLEAPFKNINQISTRSIASQLREEDLNVFMKRIYSQVIELNQKNLSYSTPDEWDNSFEYLENKQAYRKSYAILKRMTWNKFLNLIKEFSLKQDS